MTKMLIDRSTVEQALEALQNCANGEDDVLLTRDALAALRAALAEPDIDPVDEYRKGFIDGQIDMRDRPAEPQEPDSPERRCGGPGCDMKCCHPVEENKDA